MFLLSVENLEKTEKGKPNNNNKNPTFMGICTSHLKNSFMHTNALKHNWVVLFCGT